METKRIFRGKQDELQSRLVSDFIGNTPFVRLSEKVYAKLESVNPGGSIKDRPVKWILDDAEEKGLLKPTRVQEFAISPGEFPSSWRLMELQINQF